MLQGPAYFDPKDPFVRPLVEAGARQAAEIFAEQGKTHAAVIEAVRRTHDFAEEASRALDENRPAHHLPIACAEGCAFCCRANPVAIQTAEAFALAAHLRERLSPEALSALAARARDSLARARDLDAAARAAAKIACPLLDPASGACTAYEARPIPCRAYNSCDRDRCAAAFEAAEVNAALPASAPMFLASHAAGFGLMTAASVAGLEIGPYDMTSALAAVLGDGSAEERWLAGETVFTHTRASAAAAEGTTRIVAGFAADLRSGKLRTALSLASALDPDERRKARNRRKALKKR